MLDAPLPFGAYGHLAGLEQWGLPAGTFVVAGQVRSTHVVECFLWDDAGNFLARGRTSGQPLVDGGPPSFPVTGAFMFAAPETVSLYCGYLDHSPAWSLDRLDLHIVQVTPA